MPNLRKTKKRQEQGNNYWFLIGFGVSIFWAGLALGTGTPRITLIHALLTALVSSVYVSGILGFIYGVQKLFQHQYKIVENKKNHKNQIDNVTSYKRAHQLNMDQSFLGSFSLYKTYVSQTKDQRTRKASCLIQPSLFCSSSVAKPICR